MDKKRFSLLIDDDASTQEQPASIPKADLDIERKQHKTLPYNYPLEVGFKKSSNYGLDASGERVKLEGKLLQMQY